MTEIAAYGIAKRTVAADEADVHVERIALSGYSVIANVVPAPTLERLRDLIDRGLEEQTRHAGGYAALKRLGENDTLRACPALDPLFVEIARHPQVMTLCRRLLGDYFILMLQNAIALPGEMRAHQQASFHRDLPYQHFVSSRPLSINALLCVDAFTVENGCTRVLPGSHKMEPFPSEAVVKCLETPLEAPAGSFLVFDAMLYHGGGTNTSSSPRRGINTAYCLPFMKQQISLPSLLGPDYTTDPALRQFLGYETEPPKSIEGWYEQRRERIGRRG
jgi:ectoine hydroxylase-related dioxygenase (phytanoyl-CoA dioxygenase family)